MARFLTDLDITVKSDNIYELKSLLVYESDLAGKLIVPIRFQTDLASVPRVPIVYAIWGNRAHREAVLHDAMFRKNFYKKVSFMMANKIFLEAMKATGKPFYIRYPMYVAVCVGAYPHWHKRNIGDRLY